MPKRVIRCFDDEPKFEQLEKGIKVYLQKLDIQYQHRYHGELPDKNKTRAFGNDLYSRFKKKVKPLLLSKKLECKKILTIAIYDIA